MTGQTGNSKFNARADAAAVALLDGLRKQGRDVQQRTVQVGPDGQPAKPLPPKGSYARMAIESQRAETVLAQDEPVAQQQLETPPQQPEEPEAAQLPQAEETAVAEAESDVLSDNAKRRFTQLTNKLREAERERDQERAERDRYGGELRTLKEELDALRQEREQLLSQSLDGLDPEQRAAFLADARIKRALQEQEQRLEAKFKPQIEGLRERSVENDLIRLSQKYPRFDIDIHGALIEQYRDKNPNSSVEQAFKAVAEPDEIALKPTRTHVPPVVEPGSGPNAVRHVPVPQKDPEEDMRADARKAAEMRRSPDPEVQKAGMRLMERNIAMRYAHRIGT